MPLDLQTRKERDRSNTNPRPERVAIIMDGNGRWAVQRGLPRAIGHQQGAKTVRKITEYCRENEVKVLTLTHSANKIGLGPLQKLKPLWFF